MLKKKLAALWSLLPPPHRKRTVQGAVAYAALIAVLVLWVGMGAEKTLKDWNGKIPQASAPIVNIAPAAVKTGDGGVQLLPQGQTRGYVSVVLTNAGLSASMTERALNELPAEIALAFSPYGADTGNWLKKAALGKRESLLLVPMEPATYPKDDPGPKALLTRLSTDENAKNLEWIFGRGGEFTGAMNFMGSRLLGEEKNMRQIFEALRKKNAFFMENPAVPGDPQAFLSAREAGIPYVSADIAIDTKGTETSIRQQLLSLEKLAEVRGYAVGVAQPYPVTLSALKNWAASLDNRGIQLVALTTLLQTAHPHEQTENTGAGEPDTP